MNNLPNSASSQELSSWRAWANQHIKTTKPNIAQGLTQDAWKPITTTQTQLPSPYRGCNSCRRHRG